MEKIQQYLINCHKGLRHNLNCEMDRAGAKDEERTRLSMEKIPFFLVNCVTGF